MPFDVLMPQLGMTMTEGSVVQWLKKPGEVIEKGECLFIVQTDKVDMEIESSCSGTFMEALVELGQLVPVGTVIGRIAQAESGETSELPRQDVTRISTPMQDQMLASVVPPSVAERPPSSNSEARKIASPRAKKLARELGLDVSLVPEYGGGGRITEADVRRFFEERSSPGPKSTIASEEVSEDG